MNERERKLYASIKDLAVQDAKASQIRATISEGVTALAEKYQLQKSTVRGLIKRENMDEAQRIDAYRREHELDSLVVALGLFSDTPLGEAALEAAGEKKPAKPPKAAEEKKPKPKKPPVVKAKKYDIGANPEPTFQ